MKMAFQLALILLLWLALSLQAATTVTNITAGDGYSLFVKSDGSLWGMGGNESGQLGDGTFNSTNKPEQIISSNVVAAATGAFVAYNGGVIFFEPYSLFIKSDSSLWSMGANGVGQLGDGTYPYGTNQPVEIVSNGVVAVAAGGGDSLFIKSDGSLWGMGDNDSGQLGDGTSGYNNDTNQPVEIVSSNVVAIAAGYDHSLFLKSDGSLWGMGNNAEGELGNRTFDWTNLPVQIISNNVVAVAAGNYYSLFVKSDGSLWGMGENTFGQLGDGTNAEATPLEEITSSNVVAVAAGGDHSLFIKSDSSLWGMGDNSDGELGGGTYSTNYPYGTNQPVEIVSNGVVAVAVGSIYSLFLKSDGSLWGMGDNADGELGDGFNTGSLVSEQIVPLAPPVLAPPILAGGPWLRGTCFAGGTYCLLSSTNATLPLSQWTPVWTNTIVHRGPNNFSAPLPDDVLLRDPQRFYLLQAQ
jgi:alpha-tubulin suppressor-like RCC1 family protein